MTSTQELFTAIEAGDTDQVVAIVEADPSVAAARDEHGVSALMRARYRFDAASSNAIRMALTNLDVFEAASFGDLDRLTEIVEADPPLAAARSTDGFTALHLAAFFGKSDAARLLLMRGADPDAVGTGWMTGTALHSAVSGRHHDVAAILLDAGADPDLRQAMGWTPLHGAAHNGEIRTVELLLAHGAAVDVVDDDGITASEMARSEGHDEIAELLGQAAP